MRKALAVDGFERSLGLSILGGEQCKLGREIVPPALALPAVGKARPRSSEALLPDISGPLVSLGSGAWEGCSSNLAAEHLGCSPAPDQIEQDDSGDGVKRSCLDGRDGKMDYSQDLRCFSAPDQTEQGSRK
jgi:hypothetical protein